MPISIGVIGAGVMGSEHVRRLAAEVDGADVAAVADADLARACLAEGKPVLCEKPLATTAEASLLVAEAEAATGRRFVQVGFMRRFDPAYTAMKRELYEGRVGELLMVHCAHRN